MKKFGIPNMCWVLQGWLRHSFVKRLIGGQSGRMLFFTKRWRQGKWVIKNGINVAQDYSVILLSVKIYSCSSVCVTWVGKLIFFLSNDCIAFHSYVVEFSSKFDFNFQDYLLHIALQVSLKEQFALQVFRTLGLPNYAEIRIFCQIV